MHHIFYEIKDNKNIKRLLLESVYKSYNIKCHVLDASKSFARQNSDKTLSETLGLIDTESNVHFVFIKRHNPFNDSEYIETGFSVGNYYLFIEMNLKHFNYFIEEFEMIEKKD